ncbi:putative phosphoenolpyruvate synthase [Trichonephila inaurata madagascariensis]|uniref:Putative phosphoenolpyruvate synthase n=1 Tax=Trichonephila inaurata madagascariensis TaxID=2747483 RepID=A0A8X6WNQ0_9ARAC|nr:putative phosphoenolpyruvate synthase [Trichonephila inaurata madagascariensis]
MSWLPRFRKTKMACVASALSRTLAPGVWFLNLVCADQVERNRGHLVWTLSFNFSLMSDPSRGKWIRSFWSSFCRYEKKKEKYFSAYIPLDFISKCLLRFVLPNCRRAIRAREAGKSLTIKSFHHWRKGYRHLGKLMVSEGRLPNEELIFFLTLDEINDLLITRSPSIISRANSRMKMYPTLDKYKFPEIMKGLPKPVNDEDESAETYEFPDEILITYSTDIGWSPYFPIISGVVTELGGLISHGAVVSREYGLPCVVGLQGATKNFRTGDYVLLDGKKGVLQRLPQPES